MVTGVKRGILGGQEVEQRGPGCLPDLPPASSVPLSTHSFFLAGNQGSPLLSPGVGQEMQRDTAKQP